MNPRGTSVTSCHANPSTPLVKTRTCLIATKSLLIASTSKLRGQVKWEGDLIFLEILQGIRNDREYRLTQQTLMTLGRLELFGEGMRYS